MLLLNGSVLDTFTRFVDSDLCTSLISSSFPSEGQGKRLAPGLAWKASWISFLIASTFSVARWNFKSRL